MKKKITVLLLIVFILSFISSNVLAVNQNDTSDSLPVHDTKVYKNLPNKDDYVRPSAQAILSDFAPSANQHPRVMIDRDGLSELKKQINNGPKSYWYSKLKTRADSICYGLLNDTENNLFKYTKCYLTRMPGIGGKGNAADQFKDRMMTLGMMYMLLKDGETFGDHKYTKADCAAAAMKMLERVMSFSDINPWHDLDFGFFCQGYAIAYDWMYDAWTESRREKLENAIKWHCFRPANDSFTSNVTSSSQTSDNGVVMGVYTVHNHNAICNSGIVMASLALMDKYPNITSSLCHDAFICSERLLNEFAPSGLTTEGVEYYLLSIENLSMMFSTMEASLGKLYGLDTCTGLEGGKPIKGIHALESDAGSFSYGDTYDSLLSSPGILYFDKHYDLHGYRNKDYELVKQRFATDYTKNVEVLCWYEPEAADAQANFALDHTVQGISSWATFRDHFDAGQTFVGVKAGTTADQHFLHLDEGSFVFNALGVRWACDMGKDDYGLPGYTDVQSNDDRWKIFRLRPDGHNTLLINPNPNDFGYELNKNSTLQTWTTDSGAKAVVDLSALVSSKATSDKRGFLFDDNRQTLVVRDEVSLKGKSDLYWIMYTEQSVRIDGNSAILSAKDKNKKDVYVKLDFASSAAGTLYTESAAPWDKAPHVDGQKDNSGYTRIVYKISGATGDVNITAKLIPVRESTASVWAAKDYGSISSWTLEQSVKPPTATPTAVPSVTSAPTATTAATANPTATTGAKPTSSASAAATTTPSAGSATPTAASSTATSAPAKPTSSATATAKPNATKSPEATGTPQEVEAKKDIAAFVDRIYTYVLNREPEPEGAAFWTDELYSFRRTGAEVGLQFIFSDEFTSRGTTDDEFVTILYKTFFDRTPEEEGFKFWTDALKNGTMDRMAVATGFVYSQEWADICATYGIRSGGDLKPTVKISPTDLTYAFVERMYTTAMRREYDAEGREYWATLLSNFEMTGEQVGAFFFLSDEMESYGLTNEQFLERLYLTFMDRDSDAEGLQFWLDGMSSGMTRTDVVFGFTRSPEFTAKCIEARILPY